MRTALCLAGCAALLLAPACAKDKQRQADLGTFKATAYSVEGVTKRGAETRRGVVAADRSILPLGTVIEVSGVGQYSGTYVVSDTGPAVNGREIDIYIPNDAEAKAFGVKTVQVQVKRWGSDEVLATSPSSSGNGAATGQK